MLDRPGATDRVDGGGHATLAGDDLLRAERNLRRFLRRESERLVTPVAM